MTAPNEEYSGPIWFWHSGMNALVCAPLDGTNQAKAFSLETIREAGFKVDPDGFRNSLPRLDEPQLARAAQAADVAHEVAMAKARAEFEKNMRRPGRR
jgi:hypothetical protein